VDWVTGALHSKVLFLLLVNVFLLIVGMLMDVYAATVIVVPLLIPWGRRSASIPSTSASSFSQISN
jgi:TRAP-type C4-dicarboxylate transport system permease large subunit